MLKRALPALVVLIGVLGCNPKSGPQTDVLSPSTEAEAGEQVVGRVGGVPIYASAVRELMTKEGISAQTAFDALCDQELLVQRARQTGAEESREIAWLTERLLVQALLGEMEAEVNPGTITDSAVKEDFETNKDKFGFPERRKTVHVLARNQGPEAEAFAKAVLSEFRQADDPIEVFEHYNTSPPEEPFAVIAEDLPAISLKDGFVEEFKKAVFAAKRPGPLSAPVKTTFGWHAILLQEIQPEEVKTLADMEDSIRERLTQKSRFESLASMVRTSEEALGVQRNEDVINRAMRAALPSEERE